MKWHQHETVRWLVAIALVAGVAWAGGWVRGVQLPTAEMAASDCENNGVFVYGGTTYACLVLTRGIQAD